MGPLLYDRVRETTTSTGTGTVNLAGAATGFRTFVSAVGNGNTCYYVIAGGSEWEVGIGTVTDATPDTLSRDKILASSNSGAAVNFSAGTKDVFLTAPASILLPNHAACDGRLTLESGVPVSTSDQTGKTNVYFTPYRGNRIGIFNGSSWELRSFSELTLALGTLTSGKNYDVFIYDNSGTLTLEALAWTDDTTRATALTTQDGVYVKNGATTRRYLGTFRTTSTTTTEDSAASRFLWNAYNRVNRRVQKTDTTSSWTYGTTTIRQARGSTSNQIAVVAGLAESLLYLHVGQTSLGTSIGVLLAGIGEDSTTALAAECAAGNYTAFNAVNALYGVSHNTLSKTVPVGYHYYPWLEIATAASSCTAFGDDTAALRRCGLIGTYQC